MFALTPRRPLATLAVVTGLLIAAAPATAGIAVGNPGDAPAQKSHPPKTICAFPDVCATSTRGVWLGSNDALGILYNGHAGLGAN